MDGGYDVYTCHFGQEFRMLAAVLEQSVKQNCPAATFWQDQMPPPPIVVGVRKSAPNNIAKLVLWRERLMRATRPIALLDTDTFVCRDLAPIWEHDFDVAYCQRPNTYPIIGGVLFARPTAAAKAFFTEWLCLASRLLLRPLEIDPLMSQYGGLNQYCIWQLTQMPMNTIGLLALTAEEWNCCDQVWHTFDPQKTRIVHLKGRLREELKRGHMDPDGPNKDLAPIMAEWLRYRLASYEQNGRA